jgi:regulator of nucleoside diphosphate kinase
VREKSRRKVRRDPLLITSYDRNRLLRLLGSLQASGMESRHLEELEFEVDRATPVPSKRIPPDVVTMNSAPRVTDLETGESRVITIVFPAFADEAAGRISIVAPTGTALLGYRAGDVVRVDAPDGERRLRIDEITYQPEAAGDFQL